ncbi:MAG: hypothetical protein WC488_00065 [Candidatus Micrarchaeia archaeon]
MNFKFSDTPVMDEGINNRMIIPARFEVGSEETLCAVLSPDEMLVLALCTMTRWCGIAHLDVPKPGYGSFSVQEALERLFRGRSGLLKTTEAGILVFGKEENAAMQAGVEWLSVRKIQVETRFVKPVPERSKVQAKLDPSWKKARVFGQEIQNPQNASSGQNTDFRRRVLPL